ncbi:hypothetical protein D3C80_1176010 [compost metagenome]
MHPQPTADQQPRVDGHIGGRHIAQHHHAPTEGHAAQGVFEGAAEVFHGDVHAPLRGEFPDLGAVVAAADNHVIGTQAVQKIALVRTARDGDDTRTRRLGQLNLMGAQATAGAIDQHAFTRFERGFTVQCANAGADRAGGQRGLDVVQTVGQFDGGDRRHPKVFGIGAFSVHRWQAQSPAQVLATAQAVAALAAKSALIHHHSGADHQVVHTRANLNHFTRHFMAQNNAGVGPRQPPGAMQQVVMTNPGCRYPDQHFTRANPRGRHLLDLQLLRSAEGF